MHKTAPIYLLVGLGIMAGGILLAQAKVTDLTKQEIANDQTKESMFNMANPNAALVAGGNFYVSSPSPAYEVDVEKAYLNAAFQDFTITLVNGQNYVVPARIRLIDQKIEVLVDGQEYDLDGQVLKDAVDSNGRTFVSMFDPLQRIKGAQVYEVAFAGNSSRLLANVAIAWEDPPRQNMFDTQQATKKMKQVTRVYLITPTESIEVRQLKDIMQNLGIDRQSRSYQYAKSQKLNNRVEDFVALLKFHEGVDR